MEQEKEHQWTLHVHEEEEEVEEAALERRKFLQHSNGNGVATVVNDPDGSLVVQKEEEEEEHADKGNVVVAGGDNGNHFFNGEKSDFGAVGLGIVAEFVGEAAATNGMWKCHHCTWTKQFDSPWTVPVSKLEYPDLLMTFKTMTQHGPCIISEIEGNEANNGLNEVHNGDSARSVNPTNHAESKTDVQVEDAVNHNSPCNDGNNRCIKSVDGKVPSSSDLSHVDNSSDLQATPVTNFDDGDRSKEGLNFIEEIDNQLKDYDVEAVLAKQETHELFCPNCHSCITKRVIVKKRKRTAHKVEDKAKRDKLDAVVISNLVDGFAQEANQGEQPNITPDIVSVEQPDDGSCDPETEPQVFRCLSCFSFFIPSGKCFNLFRSHAGAREPEMSQNPSVVPGAASNSQNLLNIPSSNANWLFSLFTPKKGKKASEQGNASIEHSRTGPAVQHRPASDSSNMQISPDSGHHVEDQLADTYIVKDVKPMPYTDHGHEGLNSQNSSLVKSLKTEPLVENDMKYNMASENEPLLADQKHLDSVFKNGSSSIPVSTKNSGHVETREGKKNNDPADVIKTSSKHESVQSTIAATTEVLVNGGKPEKDAILNPYEGKPEFRGPMTAESPIIVVSPKGVDMSETIQKSYSFLKQGTQSSVQPFGNAVLACDVGSNKQGSITGAIISSKQGFTLTENVQKNIEEEINPSDRKEKKGGDVIVFVEGGVESKISQTEDTVPAGGAIITESHNQTRISEHVTNEIVEPEPRQWEVLKSIVYGGLVESITSLGIVSSAAGSSASPLSIIALGLANLIGGLFILGHNLSELKNDRSEADQQQTNDRYQELLGHRENFLLHVAIAVLSFLIFGSVPIVVYGLFISKNYHNEVKLAAVAAASVACIVLLAIGKVYTKRPPKSYIKTVSYYVTLAVSASGVSYIGGNLIKDLLDKFNHSESGFAIAMPLSDNGLGPKWMSY